MEMLPTNYCLHSIYRHAHLAVHPVPLAVNHLLVLNIHTALPTEQKQVKAYFLIILLQNQKMLASERIQIFVQLSHSNNIRKGKEKKEAEMQRLTYGYGHKAT